MSLPLVSYWQPPQDNLLMQTHVDLSFWTNLYLSLLSPLLWHQNLQEYRNWGSPTLQKRIKDAATFYFLLNLKLCWLKKTRCTLRFLIWDSSEQRSGLYPPYCSCCCQKHYSAHFWFQKAYNKRSFNKFELFKLGNVWACHFSTARLIFSCPEI